MINHRRRAFLFLAGSLAASGGAVALVPRHKIADDRPLAVCAWARRNVTLSTPLPASFTGLPLGSAASALVKAN